MTTNTLRQDLHDITENKSVDWQTKNSTIFGPLKEKHHHNIELIEEFGPTLADGGLYNCYRYALNVHESEDIDNIERTAGEILKFSTVFITYLITESILSEIASEQTRDGDIVIYFEDGTPKHAGKINNRRIISKWGMSGPLMRHDLFEVPISYGDEVKYYSNIPAEKVFPEFYGYLQG